MNQNELKEIVRYDSESGKLFWLKRLSHGTKVGGEVGCISKQGYMQTKNYGEHYLIHRLIWLYTYGEWPTEIDHINHIRDDNRIENLREVTRKENGKNQSMKSNNKSGINGVHWHKRDKKWVSRIKVNNKLIELGRFKDKFEAICRRLSANNKYYFHKNHGGRIDVEYKKSD